jgi:energy-coupling factor transport system permease protein
MALRFVPRFKAQARRIAYAQRGLGRSLGGGGIVRRARAGLGILSILVTWALENSVEVADSMRSRGFGTHRRTSFHLARWSRRDRAAAAWLAAAALVVGLATAAGLTSMRFFPVIAVPVAGARSVAAWLAYSTVLFMPLALNLAEELKWRRTRSST